MKESSKAILTEGPIVPALIRLGLPMVVAIGSMIAFNLVDTFFVSKLGSEELTAMGFTFPVIRIVRSVAMGIGTGVSAVISRAVGEGNHSKVQKLTTHSIFLSLIVIILFTVSGMLTIHPLFTAMGADESIIPLIRDYMIVWYPGIIFLFIQLVANNAIRATGDTKSPSIIIISAAIFNVVLDPLLIFGYGPFPRLEIMGAAIATVISRALSLCLSLYLIFYRKKMFSLSKQKYSEMIDSWKEVLYISLPTIGSNIIVPVSLGVITSLLAVYGSEAVAAFGVAARIEHFVMVVVMALVTVIAPFVGQNLGAGKSKYHRIVKGIKYSQMFGGFWGAAMFILLTGLSKPIAVLFSSDLQVISKLVSYLWIVPVSYGMFNIMMINTSVFNVMRKPLYTGVLTTGRVVILYIPLAFLLSWIFNRVEGIFAAAAISNIITGIAGFILLRRLVNSKLKRAGGDLITSQN